MQEQKEEKLIDLKGTLKQLVEADEPELSQEEAIMKFGETGKKKNLDFIVLNSLRNEGTCFKSDENQISIISRDGQKDYDKKSKADVARDIIDELSTKL